MGLAMGAAAGLVFHHNIDVLVEVVQETAEPIKREVFQLPPHQR